MTGCEAVTLEAFMGLPKEERLARCGELSAHDAYRLRMTEPMVAAKLSCNECIHYRGYAKCKAFPEGIGRDHIRALIDDPTTECANGLKFKSKHED